MKSLVIVGKDATQKMTKKKCKAISVTMIVIGTAVSL
jgi:hypothetical protein